MKKYPPILACLACLVGPLALLLGGCVERDEGRPVMVADVPAFEVSEVPAELDTYPHAFFRGSLAYFVDGRWFYRTDAGFVVLRAEPAELARYRVAIASSPVHVR